MAARQAGPRLDEVASSRNFLSPRLLNTDKEQAAGGVAFAPTLLKSELRIERNG
jgi:hypothetical protein